MGTTKKAFARSPRGEPGDERLCSNGVSDRRWPDLDMTFSKPRATDCQAFVIRQLASKRVQGTAPTGCIPASDTPLWCAALPAQANPFCSRKRTRAGLGLQGEGYGEEHRAADQPHRPAAADAPMRAVAAEAAALILGTGAVGNPLRCTSSWVWPRPSGAATALQISAAARQLGYSVRSWPIAAVPRTQVVLA